MWLLLHVHLLNLMQISLSNTAYLNQKHTGKLILGTIVQLSYIFLPGKINSQVQSPKSCLQGGFPFTTVHQGQPAWGCSAVAAQFQVVPCIYYVEPSVNQA